MTSGQGANTEVHYGTAQAQRRRAALAPEYVSVDERSLADLLAYAASYAAHVKFSNAAGGTQDPESVLPDTWERLFEQDISVVLAIIIAYDVTEIDGKLEQAFLDMHRVPDTDQLLAIFGNLLTDLLTLSEKLAAWKGLKAGLNRWRERYRIEAEIDAAMRGDLGHDLSAFLTMLDGLLQHPEFAEHDGWRSRIDSLRGALQPIGTREGGPTGRMDPDGDLPDFLLSMGPDLQQFYRRLHLTVVYLQEIAETEFRESIEHRNDHEPHIALFIAFLRLFRYAQDELNLFSRRHLDYYYDRILNRRIQGTRPDRTMVGFALTAGAEATRVARNTQLLAGYTDDGAPIHYLTEAALTVTGARISQLKSLYVAHNPAVSTGGTYQLVSAIYSAPVANSADGCGAPFIGSDTSWPLTGEDQFDRGAADLRMQVADTGFAVASSLLQLAEGERRLRVSLHCTPDTFRALEVLLEDIAQHAEGGKTADEVFSEIFSRAFTIRLPTPTGWYAVERYHVAPLSDGQWGLSIACTLPNHAPPIVGMVEAIHGTHYATDLPVFEVKLVTGQGIYPYSFLRELLIDRLTISVAVTGLRSVIARNDLGLIDPSAPFLPFGPQPRRGSYLLVGHPELTNRNLTAVRFLLDWGNLPEWPRGFADHYAEYPGDIDNRSFTVEISALSDYEFQPANDRDEVSLFDVDRDAEHQLSPRTTISLRQQELQRLALRPLYALRELPPYTNVVRAGYFRLALRQPAMAFGHDIYPRLFAERLTQQARPRSFSLRRSAGTTDTTVPEPPYTPLVNRIGIDYSATDTLDFRKDVDESDQAVSGSTFFRTHPFGTEVAYEGRGNDNTYLLPRFRYDGYLLLGIENLRPPQSLSLFFDLAVGPSSASEGKLEIHWQFWADDGWRNFGQEQIIRDSTVDLSTAGIVVLDCGKRMRKGHPLHGPDLHWLRLAVRGDVRILGRCRRIVTDAVACSWEISDDPKHRAATADNSIRITDLARRLPGIDGVRQLSPFTGGSEPESREAFYIRGSERLRHKDRAVTNWDIEHILLGAFPYLHQVKCISQTGYRSELSPGELTVVCAAKADASNITPRLGHHQLTAIKKQLGRRVSPFVDLQVINPTYERIQVSCRIRLAEGADRERGRIWKELHLALRDFICPWITGGILPIGGQISKNGVMALIGRHPEVTYVTGFSIVHIYQHAGRYGLQDTARDTYTSESVQATKPWSLLVPAEEHSIDFLDVDEYDYPEVTAIDRMRLGSDFILSEEASAPEPPPDRSQAANASSAEADILSQWLSS